MKSNTFQLSRKKSASIGVEFETDLDHEDHSDQPVDVGEQLAIAGVQAVIGVEAEADRVEHDDAEDGVAAGFGMHEGADARAQVVASRRRRGDEIFRRFQRHGGRRAPRPD